VPPKRRGFYTDAPANADLDLLRERNVETLIQPLIQPKHTIQRDIPVERIRPNPFQARRTFTNLDELARSIQIHGFVSRLRVRPDPVDPGYFQLVYGERRWRAAQQAGMTTIPCEIAEHKDEELIEIGLLENIQREDLDPLEEAQAFRTFIDQRGYTIRSLAERLGKSKGYVDNRLALLRAPQDVQQMVAMRPDTVASARLIAQLPSEDERRPLIRGLVEGQIAAADVRGHVTRPVKTRDVRSPDRAVERMLERSDGEESQHATRGISQATNTLDLAITQLEELLPRLSLREREDLLAYIVEHYFPWLERYVENLREHPQANL
jgi:ParB family chromosome partitioning protein